MRKGENRVRRPGARSPPRGETSGGVSSQGDLASGAGNRLRLERANALPS